MFQPRTKFLAFTLIELSVGILVSGIAILLAIQAFLIVSKMHKQFLTDRYKQNEKVLLVHSVNLLFDASTFLKWEGVKLNGQDGTGTEVVYEFYPWGAIRTSASVVDSFRIPLNTEVVLLQETDYLQELQLKFEDQATANVFKKTYAGRDLLQINNFWDGY